MARLRLIPGLSLDDANELVRQLHRHHEPVQGHKFSIGAAVSDRYVGAIIVGRPVARAYDDGFTAEATRCVTDGTKNACSMLYAAAWRAWRAMGGTRLITYTGASEPGTSLVAAGFRVVHQTRERAQGWNTPSRPRKPKHQNAKTLWEVAQS